ncbi:hypothetical protein QJR30_01620 [Paraclostridium sordellii]
MAKIAISYDTEREKQEIISAISKELKIKKISKEYDNQKYKKVYIFIA